MCVRVCVADNFIRDTLVLLVMEEQKLISFVTATFTVGLLAAILITRATKSQKSQICSAFFKAYETSTNQISRSYYEGIPSY